MATLAQLLHPQVIFESVTNRVKKTNDTLQRFWGVQLGSGNKEEIPGRVGSYDIFDNVRTAAKGRAPMTAAATSAPQAIHAQPVTCLRLFEKIPMYYERIFPLRKLGRPSTEVDPGGADYIERQKAVLRTKFDNAREALVAGMMLGTCQILISGEDWFIVFTGGTFTIDWQIPAGNKNQVTGSIASTWLNTTNATVFEDVLAVDTLFTSLHGWPLRHIWVNSTVWGYVTNNAGIKARSGSSNIVFTKFEGLGSINKTEYNQDDYQAEIRCLPGIVWHIYNGGLALGSESGTFTKFFGDTQAIFTIEPDPMIVSMVEGSEYVQENEMTPAQEQRTYFYPQYVREPAKIEIVGISNIMPALRVPKSIAPATVVF